MSPPRALLIGILSDVCEVAIKLPPSERLESPYDLRRRQSKVCNINSPDQIMRALVDYISYKRVVRYLKW